MAAKALYYSASLLWFALGAVCAYLAGFNAAWILVTVISAPGCLLFLILGLRAGKKDGDIPFVGY